LDRDEVGRHTVDVFYAPKYEKVTKKGSSTWMSTTKHGRELCQVHADEIRRRFDQNGHEELNMSPRAVGMAINSEFRRFLEAELHMKLPPKQEKASYDPDRLTPEEMKARSETENEAKKVATEKALVKEVAKKNRANARVIQKAAVSVQGKGAVLENEKDQVAQVLMDLRALHSKNDGFLRKIMKAAVAFVPANLRSKFDATMSVFGVDLKDLDNEIRVNSKRLDNDYRDTVNEGERSPSCM
jgi:hypothetical protein